MARGVTQLAGAGRALLGRFVPAWRMTGLSALGAVVLASVLFMAAASERMMQRSHMEMEAGLKIKLELALFHLWFEEFVQGDKSVSEVDVWRHLEAAEGHAYALLGDGENDEEALALRFPRLRSELERMLGNLQRLRAVARQRHDAFHDPSVMGYQTGSAADQRFDKVFAEVLEQTDDMKRAVHTEIERDMRQHLVLTIALIVFVVFATLGVSWMVLRHQRLLSRARDEATCADRAKSEFLANMSHELRTPLNAIIGFADILSNQMFGPLGSERYVKYSRDVRDSGRHLLEIINDVLDVSKVAAGKLELHEQPVDIGEVVHATVRLVEERAQIRHLVLQANVPDEFSRLMADKRMIKQILLNLLSNATKFTLEGGWIEVGATSAADGSIELIVADTGIGVAAQDIDKIMEPFRQVDGSLTRAHEGTGLGLSLTKSLVELHGGWLGFQSEVGVGTTVTVCFPAERTMPRAGVATQCSAVS